MRPTQSVLRLVVAATLSCGATGAAAQHSIIEGPEPHFASVATGVVPTTSLDIDRGRATHPVLERRIAVHLDEVRLNRALQEIAAAGEVRIAFSADLVPVDRLVSLDATDIALGEAFEAVLRGSDLELWVSRSGHVVVIPVSVPQSGNLRQTSLSGPPQAQLPFRQVRLAPRAVRQGIITGRVVDAATGQGMAGVQVAVLGTQFGVLTGPDGTFTIADVPPGSYRLRASRLGYAPAEQAVTVATGETTQVNLTLAASAVALDEVVVVGYGTQRRSDVTGAVASVAAERLDDVPTTNVVQALQGAVPGVVITTTAAGAEPDNQILIRGRNSILASNSPLIVLDGMPYGGNLSEINQADIASIEVLKDASAAAVYGSRGSNGVILITSKKGTGSPTFNYDGYVGVQEVANIPDLMTGPEYANFKCERLNEVLACDDALMAETLTPTELGVLQSGEWVDWHDLVLRRGTQQQHNLSISGAAGGTRYYLAGSLLDVSGVAKNDEFNRYTMRLNLDQEVSSWLSAGTSTQLSWTDRGGVPAAFSDAFDMNPLTVPFEEDGSQKIFPWPEDSFFENPLQGLLASNEDIGRRVFTSNHIDVKLPLEGLAYRLNAGLDVEYRSNATYYGRDTNRGASRLGDATTRDSDSYDWTVENILNFNREFGAHSLGLTGLYSVQEFRFKQRELLARENPGDELGYWQPDVSAFVRPSNSYRASGMVSQMGRLNYGYDDRYLLTVTARRDGSSVFGDNNKYGVFPSVALGWNLSNEAFWPFQESVNALKLRGSWGLNGNQAIAPYQTLSRLEEFSYIDGATTLPGYVPSALGNPNLQWEKSTTVNVGADFGLLSNRITGSLDLYRTSTTDLLLDRLIPSVHGIERITTNMGEVENRGLELSLSTVNVERNAFRWTSDFNISMNRNEIIDLYGDGSDDLVNDWFIGHPINVNFGYVHDGIWQEGDDIANSHMPDARPGDVRYRDVNGDGAIDADDRAIHSDPNPSYLAGLNNTLTYGNLAFSFFLHTVQGVTRNNELLNFSEVRYNNMRYNLLRVQPWTPDNPGNLHPANRDGTDPLGARYFQDASFVRLKDAILSYTVPTALADRLGMDNLRVYVAGRNLWTLTDWNGLDPELGDQYEQPLERTFTAGINVGF